MPLLGRMWPTPVAKPMAPFLAASFIVLYGVNAIQNVMMNTEEFKNDPRNPNVRNAKKE